MGTWKRWDSNPRWRKPLVLKTSSFNPSDTLPTPRYIHINIILNNFNLKSYLRKIENINTMLT